MLALLLPPQLGEVRADLEAVPFSCLEDGIDPLLVQELSDVLEADVNAGHTEQPAAGVTARSMQEPAKMPGAGRRLDRGAHRLAGAAEALRSASISRWRAPALL